MSREQYQQENRQNNDLFEEYLDDLPDEEMNVSSRVEEDVQQYVSERNQKKQKQSLFICGAVISFCLAVMINLFRSSAILKKEPEPDVQIFTPVYTAPVLTTGSDYNNMVTDAHSSQSDVNVLGTDLQVPEMMIRDQYYRLPVPMSTFLKNGWQISWQIIEDQGQEDFCRAHYTLTHTDGSGTLEVDAVVKPSAENVPEFIIVTGISDSGGLIELPQGIQSGMTEDELLDILNGSGIDSTLVETDSDEKTVTVNSPVDLFYFRNYNIGFGISDGNISTVTVTVE